MLLTLVCPCKVYKHIQALWGATMNMFSSSSSEQNNTGYSFYVKDKFLIVKPFLIEGD